MNPAHCCDDAMNAGTVILLALTACVGPTHEWHVSLHFILVHPRSGDHRLGVIEIVASRFDRHAGRLGESPYE